MTTEIAFASMGHAFARGLSLEQIRNRAPAVFATSAHARTSARYTFIRTEQVLQELMEAGFVAVDARQVISRSSLHGRHIVRLRRNYEAVQLRDAIPEIVFLNSHDGSSAYQLRLGIYRAVCPNGLIVAQAAFPTFRIVHRRDAVGEAIAAALQLAAKFESVANVVDQMERRRFAPDEQTALAEEGLGLRFGGLEQARLPASQLLIPRRAEDVGDDLWRTFNRIQENVLRGGQARRTPSGRLTRVRQIRSIKEDLRLNDALWERAQGLLQAA